MSCLSTYSRFDDQVLYTNSFATDDPQTLGSLLTYCCIDELEAAALIGAFSDMHWGYRNLNMPDSLALLQPNVELAFWLVDQLLFLEHSHVYTISVFTRLCNCLRSANLPLKETVFKILTRLFAKWVNTLQQDKSVLDAASASAQNDDGSGGGTGSTASSQHVQLPMARVAVIRDAITRHLSMSRIQATVLRRVAYERRQERLFFSSYVRSALDFIIAMSKLQETLTDLSPNLVGTSVEAPNSTAMEEDDMFASEGGMGAAAAFPQLEPPKVHQTSDTALLVQWHDTPLFNDLRSASSLSSLFELEVSDRSFRRPTTEAGTTGSRRLDDDLSFRSLYRGPALHYRMEGVTGSRTYHFRIRASSSVGGREGSAGRWSDATAIQTKAVAPFTFDRLNCGPTIFVGRDNMSASFANNESWSTVLGTSGFLCGRNMWEVHLDKTPTAYIFIGVAKRQADLSTFLGGDDFGWGYIGDRALYNKRAKVKAYGERFGEGDTIGVVLDMDRGTLAFTKNGVDLGVAFEGLSGELFPAVAFYNQGQRVSLVRSSFHCPGAGVTIPHSPSSVGIGELLELSQLMGCMLTRQSLPASLLREAHRSFLAWRAGTTFRCTTVCGYQLQLDTSDEACRAFGFRSGDRVRTPRGNGTMMGVADGKPWFQVDGESGVWFFSMCAIREGRVEGLFNPTPSTGRPASRLVDDGGAAVPERLGIAEHGLEKHDNGQLGLEAFMGLADCPRWTATMDALIVRAVSEFCHRKQLSPWNLTTRVILAVVAPVRPELLALAREADHFAAPSETQQRWTFDAQGKELDQLTELAIVCRFAVLRIFNDRLVNALPFVGFGDGLPNVAVPTPMLSVWGLPSADRGLAVGDHPRQYLKPSTLFSRGSGRGLGPILCSLRGSTFMLTKEKVLRAAIDRTTAPNKKAEDDYDYPEDLPQVMVNRPKAITARGHPDPETRLGMSLFGQLFDELHFMDPTLLRMGYTHPMDDGQQRTFKVKFEGEGVDDYGGPYREIFAQVCDVVRGSDRGRKAIFC